VDFRDVPVAIARTFPEYNGTPAVREIEALYLAAIAAARHTIYIETQYFSSSRITKALVTRLEEERTGSRGDKSEECGRLAGGKDHGVGPRHQPRADPQGGQA
jgi:hypothetical protein